MRKITLLAGTAFCLMATQALAQAPTAPAAPTTAPVTQLADVVVTATKRASNLQNVPVAVTAITASSIQNQRINEFGDLSRAAASLTLTESTASPNNSIILRGIGTYALSIGVEPSVAVIVDDVPVVQQAQAFDNLSDVSRIEVLRGPQGTLFGKNASAGAINIVTEDVSRLLEGSASVTVASDRDYKVDGSVSGPISDTAGYRLSGYYNNWAGNIHNLADGHLLNDSEDYGIHGKLKFDITPNLTTTLNASFSKEHSNGTSVSAEYINLTSGVTPKYNGVSILPDLVGITPGVGNRNIRVDDDGFTDNQQASISGKFVYDLGFANLISISSYQDWKYNFSADVDLTNLAVNGTAASVTNPIDPGAGVSNSGPYHATSVTQEFRLASKGIGPLSYVAGLFYEDANTSRNFARGPALVLADWTGEQGSRSLAAFGGVDYKLPTNTTLSGAVRLNNERIQDSFVNLLPSATVYVSPTNLGTCGAGSALCAGHNSDTVETWKGSVSQEWAPRISTYASVATGYKGYAYDISSGYTPLRTENPVKPEHSTSYEIGVKSRFAENRIQLNVAAYYTDYNNFQAQSSQYVDGVLQQKLNNVGKLRTQGVEVEAQARATEWLLFEGSFAYTDAKIISFPNAACYAGQVVGCGPSTNPVGLGNVQNRSGAELPNAPKTKVILGATIDHDLDSHTKGTIVLNYQYQSAVNFDLLGDPLDEQKAYGVFNGSVGAERGAYKLTFFVNNMFNQHYAVGLADNFGSYGVHYITQVVPRDADRYFGAKLGVKF